MQIHTYSQIGTFHLNHNEDFLVTAEIADNQLLIAVMDGCSMGTESHFAATLVGKILRKIAKKLYYLSFIEHQQKSLKTILMTILKALFENLITLKNDLGLEQNELLSTLILGVVNTDTNHAELITIGDGVIVYNGQIVEYEQDNRPDYLGYHLKENFENWFGRQNQLLSLKNCYDLSIITDGIFTFRKFDMDVYPKISEENIIHRLSIHQQDWNTELKLKRELIYIENEFGLKPTDDLSIIRLIWRLANVKNKHIIT